MHITKELISYNYDNAPFQHHILIANLGIEKHLLSYVNIYLKEKCTSSLKTSENYANNLKNFFTYLYKTLPKEIRHSSDFWLSASTEYIKRWQRYRVRNRDKLKKTSPSDETIYNQASLVMEFYTWAADNDLPVRFQKKSLNDKSNSKSWRLDFKKFSKQKRKTQQVSQDSGLENISTEKNKYQRTRKLYCMSNEDISSLLGAYSDPVYGACLMLSLATGMREEGVCQFPYIGTGLNAHIRTYPDILATIPNSSKTFDFSIREKGKKRTVQVNLAAWKAICENYLSLYHERKVKFLEYRKTLPEHERPPINSIFFLTQKGKPVTPEKISQVTWAQKKKHLENFKFTFHDGRGWFITRFLIRHLTREQISNHVFDITVAEMLKEQIGHEDFETTYKHYVKVASLILETLDGKFDYSVADDEFWGTLC